MREGNDGGRDLLMDRSLDVYLSNSLLFGSGTIEYVRDMKKMCIRDSFYHEQAHKLVDAWNKEINPKKSKKLLIQLLADYDKCLGHQE